MLLKNNISAPAQNRHHKHAAWFLFIGLLLWLGCAQAQLVEETSNPADQNLNTEAAAVAENILSPASETEPSSAQFDLLGSLPASPNLSSDIVLLLDNSGSMKSNDPKFLTSKAVTEFINQLEFGTRLAIVIFDQKVSMAFPLTEVTDTSRIEMLDSLKQINYRGLHTNSPAGLERAIYELKLHAREDAERFIVFLTDGIVDTGDKAKDAEGVDWMRKELAADASDNRIRIFGIAFTDGADFKLIQSLAQQTEADYYRAYTADEIAPVFDKIQTAIIDARQRAAEAALAAMQPEPEPAPVVVEAPKPPPAPIIVKVPEQPIEQDNTIQYILFGLIGLLLVVVIVIVLRRSGSGAASTAVDMPQVKLIDSMNITDSREHMLTTPITQIGRVRGKESPDVSYIIIDNKSISRHHAVIEYRSHAFWIMDQGSGNGTSLNGQRLTEERSLKHGDVISVDNFQFVFMEMDMEESDATVVQGGVPSPEPIQAASAAAPPSSPAPEPTPAPAPAHDPDEDETALLPSGSNEEDEEALAEDIDNWDFTDLGDDDDAVEEATIPPGVLKPLPDDYVAETDNEDGRGDSVEAAEDLIEKTDTGFHPAKTMTPTEFDRLFSKIDKDKK